jgi:hypothetical protein
MNRTIEHLAGAVDGAAEDPTPFHHLRLSDFFPRDLYADMLEAMPGREDYRRMSGRAAAGDVRTKLDLFPEALRHLPPPKRHVWETVSEALLSQPVREAIVRRLAPGLERRFQLEAGRVRTYAVPVLTRDLPGYRIGVHPDTRWKAVTLQIYLPPDRSIEHVGTVFHARNAQGGYEVAARMPFLPNSGYAFAVGDDTYHSVDTVGPEVRVRDSIMLTYFVDLSALQIVRNRARRWGNFVREEVRRMVGGAG